MPFKSLAQARLMWAKHPDIAARWTKEEEQSGKLPKKDKK